MRPVPSEFQSVFKTFQAWVPERKFARWCKILVVVWLVGFFIPINLIWNNHGRYGMQKTWSIFLPTTDFSQYYMAGVAARFGLWDHLFPKFKPVAHATRWRIYESDSAEADPELLEKIPDLPWWHILNIAPPPEALICLPLAFFSFQVAYKIWITGLVFATLGSFFCMVEITRRMGGVSGYVEGLLFLPGAILPLLTRLGGTDNVLMFLVLCVGIAALSWTDEHPFFLGLSLILPGLFKGLTASWCPLLFIKPIKWRTIAFLAVAAIGLNGLTLYLGGPRPYQKWLHDILPAAQDMTLQQNWDHCVNLKGTAYTWGWSEFPAVVMNGLNLLGLLALYGGFWKKSWMQPAAIADVCAAMVGALSLFYLFNSVSWMTYITLLLPFVGWALIEYDRTPPSGKMALKILVGILFVLVPAVHQALEPAFVREHHAATDFARDIYFAIETLFLVLAYRRLFGKPEFAGSTLMRGAK